MTWAVLSINIKGGTGKSTIAEELAYELNDRGHDIGVMDADVDSANLASRFGADEKVSFEGDHVIKPVEHEGMKLYSMENAFEESSFSQSGEFMSNVIQDMIESSDWGELDYLVVDCPPGSSDVFKELVRALRPNLLGAISVGIPDAVEDTGRLIKVCNHNWVPIIGFIENMSGIYCHGEKLTCNGGESGLESFSDGDQHPVEPFGSGNIKDLTEKVNGTYIGDVPLCSGDTEISEVARETISKAADEVEDAEKPHLPEDNVGQKGFIRSVWSTVSGGIKKMNSELNISELQERFGVEGRDPIAIELELTDAGAVAGMFSSIVINFEENGGVNVMRRKKAERNGIVPEGGIKMTSQDMSYAINGEKKVMRSVNGEITTEPYSIIDAVQMGDADIWGEKTVNRLAVLDRILSEVVPMSEVQEIMDNQ